MLSHKIYQANFCDVIRRQLLHALALFAIYLYMFSKVTGESEPIIIIIIGYVLREGATYKYKKLVWPMNLMKRQSLILNKFDQWCWVYILTVIVPDCHGQLETNAIDFYCIFCNKHPLTNKHPLLKFPTKVIKNSPLFKAIL